ncbi:MAG: potassium channel family protein [Thermoguttaceae bacterium]
MIEEVWLTFYIVALIAVIFGFGGIYTLLTPRNQGIAKGDEPLSPCTYGDGVYFSVVTLSSLGYGELHPVGYSRGVACVEVLFGLGWLGIVVAKITSRRLTYQVQRLFGSDAQKKLEDFIAKFEEAERALRASLEEISAMNTPGNGGRQQEQARVMSSFLAKVGSLNTACAAWADYISFELQHPRYFKLAPLDTIRRLEGKAGDVLLMLGQVVRIIPPRVLTEYLKLDQMKTIGEVLESQKTVCVAIKDQSKDEDLNRLAARVHQICADFPQNFYAVPVAAAAEAQPGQVPLGAAAPQEFIEPGR